MRRILLVAVAVVLVVSGCGSGGTQGAAGPVDTNATVRIAAPEDAWPTQGAGVKSTTFAYPLNVNVYEPLVYLGSDYTLRPGLAESWELIQPSTWRFHLRHGVTFQDGKPFTADDVMWTWAERQMKGKTLSTVVNTLGPDSVRKVDDFTVDFVPKSPNLRLPEQIVHPEGAIVERGKDFDSTPPVGTGPFRVVSYKPGQSVELERNTTYWGTAPQAKHLSITFLPDPQTRVEALRAGTVDFVMDLPPSVVPSLQGDTTVRIVRSAPGRNQLIYVNKSGVAPHDLGADPAIRKAVSMALDRKSYVDTAFEGNADPGRWMAPQSVLGASADAVAPISFDTRAAGAVLDSAGWMPGPDGIRTKNGRRLSLTLIAWAEVSDASLQTIQAQLKDVGVEIMINKAADTPTYNNFYKSNQFDLDLEVPNQNDGNPAFLPVLRMYSQNSGTQNFAPGGAFDAAAQRALSSPDHAGVQQAAGDMMKILIDEQDIVIPLAGVYRIYGMRSAVNLGDPHPSQTNQVWSSLSAAAS